jgi:hypothetical protein
MQLGCGLLLWKEVSQELFGKLLLNICDAFRRIRDE